MKKYLFYILLASLFFVGCKKNDGPIPNDVALERVPTPLVKKSGGSQAIDMTNLGAFQGKFDVGLYFASDIPPTKFDVVVRKNNDNGNIKVLQADVATFPTSFTITAAQLAALFGSPLALGDNYDISVDVYAQSGKKYEAFPAVGVGYGSGVAGQPGASTSVRYSAICQYNDAIYNGSFEILVDEWADYAPGDVVQVTRIDATHFSFMYPANGPLPIIVTVNPLTNATSVTKQVYSTLGYGAGWPYGPLFSESVASPNNVVAPCDKTFGVLLKHTVALGSFGNYFIQMRAL
ncbi:MAG: hypothetical protein JJE22_01665 [Bacteroidia bacterium]|nr:hypothetical protein [Bacteroidia bacterium]